MSNLKPEWQTIFNQFIEEKQFLENCSPDTIRAYKESWKAYKRYTDQLKEDIPIQIDDQKIKDFMVAMLKKGLKPGGANCYARGMNAFLSWMFNNAYTERHLKIPYQRTEKKVLTTYKPEDITKILEYRPRHDSQKRIHTILIFIIDTGCRINEALTLERKNIDFDNMLVTLYGKGRKERTIPISPECRKVLFRWIKSHNHDLVFCTYRGTKLRYDNIRRDLLYLLDWLGIDKSDSSFHALRRFFAKSYLKSGGNVLYLQQTLGHSSLETTKKYVEVDSEALQIAHRNLSPLARLKR